MSITHQYHISSRPRHLRSLFFVGENCTGAELRELMVRNLKLWGGRYNPIIPVVANQISDEYKNVVNHYDPDMVFYSSSVDIELIKKLFVFNPAGFMNLNDPADFRMEGLHASCFLSEAERNRPLSSAIGDIPEILKDFYQLNFLTSNETYKLNLPAEKEPFSVDMQGYSTINEYIYKKKVQLISTLSAYKLNTVILRDNHLSTDTFELILTKEKNSIPDLLYFWNRKLFITNSSLTQILLSIEELDELLKDKFFEGVLYNLTPKSSIDVTSYSLPADEVKKIVTEKLQPFSKHIRFSVISHTKFPFDILDADGLYVRNYAESINKQVFLSEKSLFYFPALSFSGVPNGNTWAVDIEIEKIGEYQKQNLKFSTRFEHLNYLHVKGRVNKRRDLSVFADNSNVSVEFKIPLFTDVVRQILSSPKILEKRHESKYKAVRISHDGAKLAAFINLFNGDLDSMHDILYDKFWFDLITELSSNTRIAGDTVSFWEIKNRCVEIMKEGGMVFTPGTHQSETNLEKGIKYTLDGFCEKGIFFIGFNFKCPTCTSKFWYSLMESQDIYSCKGCRQKHRFPIQVPFSYKLNELVKNNFCYRDATGKFKPDGNITVLKSIIRLNNSGRMSFEYSPQLNIYTDFQEGTKPITDIDIVGLPDGRLVFGEAKHSSGAFSEDGNKPLNNLIDTAKTILPDKIIISCTEDAHGRLENKKQYLIHHLNGLPIEIDAFQVSEASYDFGSHLYFYD
jgi:hypothetical protein